jgi:AAA15 family ATPase/GTPase
VKLANFQLLLEILTLEVKKKVRTNILVFTTFLCKNLILLLLGHVDWHWISNDFVVGLAQGKMSVSSDI